MNIVAFKESMVIRKILSGLILGAHGVKGMALIDAEFARRFSRSRCYDGESAADERDEARPTYESRMRGRIWRWIALHSDA